MLKAVGFIRTVDFNLGGAGPIRNLSNASTISKVRTIQQKIVKENTMRASSEAQQQRLRYYTSKRLFDIEFLLIDLMRKKRRVSQAYLVNEVQRRLLKVDLKPEHIEKQIDNLVERKLAIRDYARPTDLYFIAF